VKGANIMFLPLGLIVLLVVGGIVAYIIIQSR